MKNAKIGHLFKSPKSTRISFGSFFAIDYIYLITSFLTTYLKINSPYTLSEKTRFNHL